MRQVGIISNEGDAQRFAAHLVADGIDALAEPEQGVFAIWVRDENQLETAKTELARFLSDPGDARYQDAERSAADRRREEQRQRDKARGNVVQMRGRWGRGAAARRSPLVITLILLSVFVGISSNFGRTPEPVMNQLTFCWPMLVDADGQFEPGSGWQQIKQGQLWRVITPIFIHFGLPHLIFNMFALYAFGTQIEDKRGTWRLGLLVLAIAILSNTAQYVFGGNPYFGGMSGVCYGLFGFVWMRMLFDSNSRMYVSGFNIVIMVAWLFLCIAHELPSFRTTVGDYLDGKSVANVAHGVGLVLGMAIGYAPIAFRAKK